MQKSVEYLPAGEISKYGESASGELVPVGIPNNIT